MRRQQLTFQFVNTVQLAVAAIGLVAVFVGSGVLVGRPEWAVPLVLVAGAASASSLNRPLASFGGLNVFALDVVAGVLLITLFLQFGSGMRLNRAAIPWAILIVLLAIGLARGVSQFGVEIAFRSARLNVQIIIGGLFFSAQRAALPKMWAIARTSWIVAGLAMSVLAVIYVARTGLNNFGAEFDRPLIAPQALIVAQAALMLSAGKPSRRDTWLAGWFLFVVLLSQQRTVWIATLIGGFAMWTILSPSGARKRTLTAGAVSTGLLVTMVGVLAPTSSAGFAIRRAVAEPFNSRNTLIWRVAGWDILISQQMSGPILNILIGNVAGSGYARRLPSALGGGLVEVSAHSQWITALLSGGVIGVAAFAAATLVPVAIAWRRDYQRRTIALLTPVAVAALVYTVSYQLDMAQAVLLGLLAAAVMAGSRRPAGDSSQLNQSEPALAAS